jgi:magnesium-transporting ATPase (P-type)
MCSSIIRCLYGSSFTNTRVQAVDLEIDESNLTGETNPRRKHCEPITANSFAELALSERDNIGFMGTLVRNGELCNWF